MECVIKPSGETKTRAAIKLPNSAGRTLFTQSNLNQATTNIRYYVFLFCIPSSVNIIDRVMEDNKP